MHAPEHSEPTLSDAPDCTLTVPVHGAGAELRLFLRGGTHHLRPVLHAPCCAIRSVHAAGGPGMAP